MTDKPPERVTPIPDSVHGWFPGRGTSEQHGVKHTTPIDMPAESWIDDNPQDDLPEYEGATKEAEPVIVAVVPDPAQRWVTEWRAWQVPMVGSSEAALIAGEAPNRARTIVQFVGTIATDAVFLGSEPAAANTMNGYRLLSGNSLEMLHGQAVYALLPTGAGAGSVHVYAEHRVER